MKPTPGSPHRPHKQKISPGDGTKESLHGFPVPILNASPDFNRTISNISGWTEGNRIKEEAAMAYEQYKEDGEDFRKHKTTEDDDGNSQDTFSVNDAPFWASSEDPQNPTCLSWDTAWAGELVKQRSFKRFSICLILVHCMLCAVATFDIVTEDSEVQYLFDLAKDIFVYIMTAELFIHFLYHGLMMFSFGWLVFDFVLICAGWFIPNLLVMRTFRVVRTLRLASWIKDLKQLVMALLLVIPKMFAIFFLLLILFFVFAILFTDLFKHCYTDGITEKDYFGRLDTTLFTLFQIMTLDGWAELCKQVMTVHKWAWIPFVSFVIVSSFFFLNLVIAVVCEAVTSVHRDTVVKYIEEDISVATSVREVLKIDDQLNGLAGSLHMMMQAQITVLETLQMQQSQIQGKAASENPEHGVLLQLRKEALMTELEVTPQRKAYVNRGSSQNQEPDGSGSRARTLCLSGQASDNANRTPPRSGNLEMVALNPFALAQAGLTSEQIAVVIQALRQPQSPMRQDVSPQAKPSP
jgi:hypothetical protein